MGFFLSLGVLLQLLFAVCRVSWPLHVIIGKSSAENTLDTQISRIHNLVSNYPSNRRSDRSTSSYWQQRLNFIRPIARLTVSSCERSWRGLIDVGGQLLHQVFGVATSCSCARIMI